MSSILCCCPHCWQVQWLNVEDSEKWLEDFPQRLGSFASVPCYKCFNWHKFLDKVRLFAGERPVILVGPQGSGKSTRGEDMAYYLDRYFLDTDEPFKKNMPSEEVEFRKLEKANLALLVNKVKNDRYKYVMATGGGIVLDQENRKILKETGCIIWLDASDDVLAKRIEKDNSSHRPYGNVDLSLRRKFYQSIADLKFDTDQMREIKLND